MKKYTHKIYKMINYEQPRIKKKKKNTITIIN